MKGPWWTIEHRADFDWSNDPFYNIIGTKMNLCAKTDHLFDTAVLLSIQFILQVIFLKF
jgi:hypothetical protein